MKKTFFCTILGVMVCAFACLTACGRREEQAGSQSEIQAGEESQVSGQTEAEAGSQAGTLAGEEFQGSGQRETAADGQGESQPDSLSADSETAGQASSYTFTDDLGREVTVESYERVAVLLGSYADVWMLAGGEVCAAPDDAFEDFDLNLPEGAVNLGGTGKLNLELLLAAEPDFVLASANTSQNVEWQESLEGAGIATAYFDVADFGDYLRMLKICTDITGQPERYETYGTKLQERIDQVLERHAKDLGEESKTVLVMRASAASIRAKGSDGNVLGEMLAAFGCTNIADTDESLLENLSIESIVLQNPDYVFLVQTGDDIEGIQENIDSMFRENPLWNELDAVKNGQVHIMDKHLYNLKPNARWAEAYEELEKILYPDSTDVR